MFGKKQRESCVETACEWFQLMWALPANVVSQEGFLSSTEQMLNWQAGFSELSNDRLSVCWASFLRVHAISGLDSAQTLPTSLTQVLAEGPELQVCLMADLVVASRVGVVCFFVFPFN